MILMYKWRVLIEYWDGKKVDKYFHNKSEAINFFNANYNHSLSAQILRYDGRIWITKKFWI